MPIIGIPKTRMRMTAVCNPANAHRIGEIVTVDAVVTHGTTLPTGTKQGTRYRDADVPLKFYDLGNVEPIEGCIGYDLTEVIHNLSSYYV